MAKASKIEEDILFTVLWDRCYAAGRPSYPIHHLCTQFPPICSFSGIERIQPTCLAIPQPLGVQGNSILIAALPWSWPRAQISLNQFSPTAACPPSEPYAKSQLLGSEMDRLELGRERNNDIILKPPSSQSAFCVCEYVFYGLCLCVVKWVSGFN